eukprot:277349-Prymnesium_polylepis.2
MPPGRSHVPVCIRSRPRDRQPLDSRPAGREECSDHGFQLGVGVRELPEQPRLNPGPILWDSWLLTGLGNGDLLPLAGSDWHVSEILSLLWLPARDAFGTDE